jgi:hypothetical protein
MPKPCDHKTYLDKTCRVCTLYLTDPEYRRFYDSPESEVPPTYPAGRAPSGKPKMALGMSQKRH